MGVHTDYKTMYFQIYRGQIGGRDQWGCFFRKGNRLVGLVKFVPERGHYQFWPVGLSNWWAYELQEISEFLDNLRASDIEDQRLLTAETK